MPQRSCWQHAVHPGFLQPFASFFCSHTAPIITIVAVKSLLYPWHYLLHYPVHGRRLETYETNGEPKQSKQKHNPKTQPKTKQKPTSFQSHSIKWKGETVAGKTAPKALSWTNWHASSFEQKKIPKAKYQKLADVLFQHVLPIFDIQFISSLDPIHYKIVRRPCNNILLVVPCRQEVCRLMLPKIISIARHCRHSSKTQSLWK